MRRSTGLNAESPAALTPRSKTSSFRFLKKYTAAANGFGKPGASSLAPSVESNKIGLL